MVCTQEGTGLWAREGAHLQHGIQPKCNLGPGRSLLEQHVLAGVLDPSLEQDVSLKLVQILKASCTRNDESHGQPTK